MPVSIVTGFLGSGKTTLIRRLLRDPAFGRTAVIVNEFGEIALDHDLIASSDESMLTLNTGCLCCAVQTDLARTLGDLAERRRRGEVVYDRVLIETSGLANPGPMIQAILTDKAVGADHRIDSILTLADAVHGEAALDGHGEARLQVAVADALLISKQDIRPPGNDLLARLRALNPSAQMLPVAEATVGTLFCRTADRRAVPETVSVASHRQEIQTFTLIRAMPVPALALTLFLEALAEHAGPRLLRMKGLVGLEEMPGRPAVIHGVHHVFSAPEFLERWPSRDETTRIVFIGKTIPPFFPARLLGAIEEEVRDAGKNLNLR
jgi:G3E family GTPase